ncbi:MAG: carboxypeptidase-like regulatory domain-containing protein [Acidobacteriota bacterium]
MQTSRSKLTTALLAAGFVFGLAALTTYQISAQAPAAKGKAKAATTTTKAGVAAGGLFAGYISGVVQSENGPEAGVWVIAETKDTLTNFIKIVVTDDQGRYLLPELPPANYDVWVRGYGLLDSSKTKAKPGAENLAIKVTTAKTPQDAAKVYPGNYWLSMLAPPANTKDNFPGTGAEGNGMPTAMLTQNHWLNSFKSQCNFCHQLGNAITRDVGIVLKNKPDIKTHEAAWDYRLLIGTRGSQMYSALQSEGKTATLKAFADWTRSIEAGAVPAEKPARPTGIERNIVTTLWDIGDDHSFVHDQVATSKYKPTVNGNGRIYAVSAGHGQLLWVDPRENNAVALDIPTRAPRAEVPSRFPKPTRTSFYWGDEHLWSNPPYDPADPHNAMVANDGKVWMTTKIRTAEPAWCNDGKSEYSKWFPLNNSGRQAGYFDPKTNQFALIDTCYSTHHIQFDNDREDNATVYFNELSGPIIGWVDTKIYAETKDETKAVGWCGQVLDTNGDGKINPAPWNQVAAARGGEESILYAGDTGGAGAKGKGKAAPVDPKLDSQVRYSLYSVIPSPVDDTVWGISESFPGMLVRLQRGANPPSTCKSMIFRIPSPGFDPRGVDIDSNGVVWTALAGSSHLASFDIRKCKDLTGPAKTDGSQCREGWSLYQTTGPKLKGTTVPADFHYYNWVDQQNIIGLGKNTPIATGSNSDSLLALNPATGTWTTFRVPYPLGFYSRGMDGRIDDPNAGWKGRALYSNYGTHLVWHIEGGKGTKGKIVKFQVRPTPLDR